MRVLVTGGTGRVGAHVVRELVDHGHEVLVFDTVRSTDVRCTAGDVTDLGQLVGAVKMIGAEVIAHLAAVPIAGFTTDEELFRVNVQGTFNAYEAARLMDVPRVVLMSSDAVYGWPIAADLMPAYLPIDEDHPCHPQHPWSLSKTVGESIGASFAERGVTSVELRPPRVLDAGMRTALREAGGAATRPQFEPFSWVASEDLAAATRLAVELPDLPSGPLLVCADDSCVAEPLADLLPRLDPRIGDTAAGLTGTTSAVSNARARAVLGWTPTRGWR